MKARQPGWNRLSSDRLVYPAMRSAALEAFRVLSPCHLNELNSIAPLVLVRRADFLSTFDKPQRSLQYYDKVFAFTQPAVFGKLAFIFWRLIKGAKPPALDATASSSADG